MIMRKIQPQSILQDSDQWLQQLGFAWKLNPVVLDSSCLLGNRSQGNV